MSSKPTSIVSTILVLQILMWIQLISFGAMSAVYLYVFGEIIEFSYLEAFILIDFVFAVLYYFISKALEKGEKWARLSTIILGILLLFGFPIGTAIGILFIYAMTKGWPKETPTIN
ncbi:hypothetical protein JHD50_01725 [Sulfurimonas sp. MAG313]|nr:hypothetical protein [Sulfurimonas sp. MAG313]MDF1880029.1 hypothetical protein [Sulfurimonas sp. MAG313]